MSRTLVRRAVALADLMTLSGEIGAAARVEDDGSVSIVSSIDPAPRRIGATIEDAVRHLREAQGLGTAAVTRHGRAS